MTEYKKSELIAQSTLKQQCLSYLVSNGMSDNEAENLFNLFIDKDFNEAMKNRWDEPSENYPPVILKISLISLRRFAFEWISENNPMAWYKSMFQY